MNEEKQVNELAWKTRIHYDHMIERGYPIGQVTIMNIMISISQYAQARGPAASIGMMTACLNAIMSGGDIDIATINGFKEKSMEELMEIDFQADGNWLHPDATEDNPKMWDGPKDEQELKDYLNIKDHQPAKEDNVIYLDKLGIDWNKKED